MTASYSHHVKEIFSAVITEYTDWASVARHPVTTRQPNTRTHHPWRHTVRSAAYGYLMIQTFCHNFNLFGLRPSEVNFRRKQNLQKSETLLTASVIILMSPIMTSTIYATFRARVKL